MFKSTVGFNNMFVDNSVIFRRTYRKPASNNINLWILLAKQSITFFVCGQDSSFEMDIVTFMQKVCRYEIIHHLITHFILLKSHQMKIPSLQHGFVEHWDIITSLYHDRKHSNCKNVSFLVNMVSNSHALGAKYFGFVLC